MQTRFEELNQIIQDPELIKNPKKYKETMREHAYLSEVNEAFGEYKKLLQGIEDAKHLITEESDHDMKEFAREELKELEEKQPGVEEKLKLLLIPPDPLEEKNIIMATKEFPNLKNYKGLTLITTDGTTLLGADDKAGIVEIVEAVKYLSEHPEIEHGDIRIAFGPDEEIGRGADHFDAKGFGTEYAYTMDGSVLGELQYESFNAAQITYKITGVSVHPGTAKGKMKNANMIAAELAMLFPEKEVPEHTDDYEGFYLLYNMEARIESAEMSYIIRDHDKEKFLARKKFAEEVAAKINAKYGNVVEYEMCDQYYNMGDVIKEDKRCVDIAEQAMKNADVVPIIIPIRGGTDGSKISYMGIPTPNIFVGGENFHGQYEFSCLEHMKKASDVIVEIAKLAKK